MSPLLLSALILVESGGDPGAVGDNGRAHGCLQIRSECLADVNRISGRHFTCDDCYDPAKAREIATIYLLHYGRGASDRELAGIWNCGPSRRHRLSATYWTRVELAKIVVRTAEPFTVSFDYE